MAAPTFDDDLFDFNLDGASVEEEGSADSAGLDDSGFAAGAVDGDVDAEPEANEGSLGSSEKRRRKRGSRGGSNTSDKDRKWRSGAAPEFDGDVERNPYCLRHYRRKLLRWVRITKEFLPPNEQALRALEKLTGEAELEFEEVPNDRFDKADGIKILLQDLDKAFGEREIFRQGGVIREFESIGRMQGESINAFIRMFRLLERKLSDNKVPEYPEQARVIKLLDGLRLDEKSTAAVLLAAGNRYCMKDVLEALRIQYPPGMTITGLPRGLASLPSRTSRSVSSRASSNRSTTSNSTRRSSRSSRWTQWQTEWDPTIYEDQYEDDEPEADVEEQGADQENYEPNDVEHYDEQEEEELIPDDSQVADEGDNGGVDEVSALLAATEALTVTSKKLAGMMQSRGFYMDGKGKDKGKGKSSDRKGKGKGKPKSGGKTAGKGKSAGRKGPGKPSAAANSGDRQRRLQGALCLGCGAADHWIRECPHVTPFQAQLASADVELDAEGVPVVHVGWMVSTEDPESEEKVCYDVPRPPSVLLSKCEDASYMIADTGCQRQVAGSVWHQQRQIETLFLCPLRYAESCRFSFGPTKSMPSKGRYLYPTGIAGQLVMMGISEVEAPAPGLLSRPTMEALGAVPDVLAGVMHFKAFNASTQLYLSPCGHLALRVDEWPSECFEWPGKYGKMNFPRQGPSDVLHDKMFSPEDVRLQAISNSKAKEHPRWLVNWRWLLVHLQEFITTTQQAVLFYSAATLRPRLKDAVLKEFMEPCSAVTMMGTQAAMAAAQALQLNSYAKNPEKCDHTSGTGTRTYAAGGQRIRICDACGMRWAITAKGEAIAATPKASPSAKTPLGLTDAQKKKIAQAKSKTAAAPPEKGALSDGSWSRLSASSRVPLPDRAPPPPPTSSWERPTQNPSMFQLFGQGRRPRQWHASRSNAGSDTDMSTTSQSTSRKHKPKPANKLLEDTGLTPEELDAILMSQADDVNSWEERMSRDDWDVDMRDQMPSAMRREFEERRMRRDDDGEEPGDLAELLPHPCGSADDPLGDEDRGCFPLKPRTRKRLSGAARSLWEAWQVEAQVYSQRAAASRKLREHLADVVEIGSSPWSLSECAIRAGLRVAEPLDGMQELPSAIENAILDRKPYVIYWELPENDRAKLYLSGWARLLRKGLLRDVDVIVRARHDHPAWFTKEFTELQAVSDSQPVRFGKYLYLCKLQPVLEELADMSGNEDHARAVLRGVQRSLHQAGDERWNQNWCVETSLPGEATAWIQDAHLQPAMPLSVHTWEPPGEATAEVFFLDITRHEDSWKPLLDEAETRLKGMTTNAVTLKPSPFYERVKALVPWKLKGSRSSVEVSQEGIQHRGAALLYNDGTIGLEAEKVSTIIEAPTSKYAKPVRIAIYFYGDAPSTSMNDKDNDQPEPAKVRVTPPEADTNEEMLPNQPGYRDISFPGVDIPKFIQQVLRRLHCNLGHLPKETLVRHLATAKASELALKGARHLRCEVCLRVSPPHQPRVSKAFQARRFNDRLCLDILYLKDIRRGTHIFLNCVDDATCYQSASRLQSRSEENVVSNLVNGWFCFFGAPDEMALDAEGAFRGMRFESLHAQLNVDVRCIPPDAHWQLGKAERHGQALRYNASRLINQFAALTIPEVNLCVAMACQAKNRLLRRSGSSPGIRERPQAAGCSLLTNDSERLLQIESVRTQAMINRHEYEASQALRAALLRVKAAPIKVAYYRKRTAAGDGEGTVEGYRQGIVLALDRNPSSNVAVNIWIRNSRGRLVQCSPEQDLEVLRKSDKELQIHPRAFRPVDRPGLESDGRVLAELEGAVDTPNAGPTAEELQSLWTQQASAHVDTAHAEIGTGHSEIEGEIEIYAQGRARFCPFGS
ncbi:unnamed protein product [Symbiodinium sp. CCMP2592]|nr:unnamed protein product [Symbiodinium sp. CCMP2592]